MDDVYRERAHLVAYLTAVYPAALKADPTDPDWPVVYVEAPQGQMSWHVSKADLPLFEHVRWDTEGEWAWDGHSTEEKYARLDARTAELASSVPWRTSKERV